MHKSRLIRFSTYFAAPFLLAQCGGDKTSGDDDGGSGGSGGSMMGGTAGTMTTTGGATSAGGSAGRAAGGTNAAGSSTGATGATGGSVGGSSGTGGANAAGTGSTSATGGTGTAGTGSVTGGAGGSVGGVGGSGGLPQGGSGSSAGGAAGGAAPIVDEGGVGLAKPGDQKTMSREYLNLGDMRVLNNKWGSDERGCNTSMRVFIQTDKTIGWDFNRGQCGDANYMGEQPDYPEIEFGVHPFGKGNVLETSPPFSSTLLLPKQLKDITSANVNVDNLAIMLQGQESWNINLEFWLSERNPLTDANPGVYAELIVFWGWQDGRWPCNKSGNVTAGGNSYHLCHQDDAWAGGKWRYFQFWVDGGPYRNFNGKVDVKALSEWLVSNYNYSRELWLTRIEVGSEIDDNTSGTVTVKNISFEINNTTKSPVFGQ